VGFRVNASKCDNAKRVLIVARHLDSPQQYPTINNFEKRLPNRIRTAWQSKFKTPEARHYFAVPPTQIYNTSSQEQGLVIVCGTTGSGKSVLADRIALYFYEKLKGRKGHILRMGDPVESDLVSESRDTDPGVISNEVLQTKRNIPKDVPNLGQFSKDALRQKPSVVTISELRDKRDFVQAMHLASTGHLVVTTAHAGSLKEGFLRLMHYARCFEDPDLKIPLVKSLHSVIHVDQRPGEEASSLSRPTVWIRTEKSEQRFIAEGIEAIFPSTSDASDCKAPLFYYKSTVNVRQCAAIAAIDVLYSQVTQDEPLSMNEALDKWTTYLSPVVADADQMKELLEHIRSKEKWKKGKRWLFEHPKTIDFRQAFGKAFSLLLTNLKTKLLT
jgi:hypothetical protein